ncbi:MAG: hypothetical protein SFT68_01635 [Rickettsiaceae bacterium]|nr:hypothetical protein [Rickettsiaceae bacterium]
MQITFWPILLNTPNFRYSPQNLDVMNDDEDYKTLTIILLDIPQPELLMLLHYISSANLHEADNIAKNYEDGTYYTKGEKYIGHENLNDVITEHNGNLCITIDVTPCSYSMVEQVILFLKNDHSIQEIDISRDYNDHSESQELNIATQIADMLKVNNSLLSLICRNHNIGLTGLNLLIDSLQYNHTLVNLDLCNNRIKWHTQPLLPWFSNIDYGKELANLKFNTTLVSLNLAHQTPSFCSHKISESIELNPTIISLKGCEDHNLTEYNKSKFLKLCEDFHKNTELTKTDAQIFRAHLLYKFLKNGDCLKQEYYPSYDFTEYLHKSPIYKNVIELKLIEFQKKVIEDYKSLIIHKGYNGLHNTQINDSTFAKISNIVLASQYEGNLANTNLETGLSEYDVHDIMNIEDNHKTNNTANFLIASPSDYLNTIVVSIWKGACQLFSISTQSIWKEVSQLFSISTQSNKRSREEDGALEDRKSKKSTTETSQENIEEYSSYNITRTQDDEKQNMLIGEEEYNPQDPN